MNEVPLVRIAKLTPEPGDVLVFEYPDVLSAQAQCNISESLSRAANGAKCIILEDGLRLAGVLGKEHAAEYKRTGKLL